MHADSDASAGYNDEDERGSSSGSGSEGLPPPPQNAPDADATRAAGEHSLEDAVFSKLCQIVDRGAEEAAEALMSDGSDYGRCFGAHARALFGGNTEEATSGRKGDWLLFCRALYPEALPALQDVQWPPEMAAWEQFLRQARSDVASEVALKRVVSNVCQVAIRYWTRRRKCLADAIDPRVLFSHQHRVAMGELRRSHGVGVRQVAPITMWEARNGTHFADHFSVRGVAACAAFAMGCLMGGRRPRTLTGILLEHIELTVGRGLVGGRWVAVPHLKVTFHEEKFPDVQGFRVATDRPFGRGYAETFLCSPAFWVYRLCVMRGLFASHDPIKQVGVGQSLAFKPEALQYYLFCEVHPDYWVDSAPSSVGTLGAWNKQILKRMGHLPRPFSAHRSGFVSRCCILAILQARGKELSTDMIEVMIRWGGWQAVTGARTVLRV